MRRTVSLYESIRVIGRDETEVGSKKWSKRGADIESQDYRFYQRIS